MAFADVDLRAETELVDDPTGLAEEVRVLVEGGDLRAPAGELDAVEAGIAAEIECGPAGEVGGQVRGELPPLERGKVAERMMRGGVRAVGQVDVAEPRRQRRGRAREPGQGFARRCRKPGYRLR